MAFNTRVKDLNVIWLAIGSHRRHVSMGDGEREGMGWSDWCFRKASVTAGDRWSMGIREKQDAPWSDWEHRAATRGTEK